jgi:hypothetical protein
VSIVESVLAVRSGAHDDTNSDNSHTTTSVSRTDEAGMRIELEQRASAIPRSDPSKPTRAFRASLRGESRPLAARDARALLGDAWSTVVGRSPSPRAVAILTAHWALETDGGRCMPGHNFAGIKAAPGAAGAELRTLEGHGAGQREVTARFRSYDSAQAGAADYVHLLATRYPAALAAAASGNAPAFTQALAAGGYFTADPVAYSAGLERRLADLERGHAATAQRVSAPGVLALALAGVLRTLEAPLEDT